MGIYRHIGKGWGGGEGEGRGMHVDRCVLKQTPALKIHC